MPSKLSEINRKVTGKEMCDVIVKADILRKEDGTAPTADEIWNSSPTCELADVFLWYAAAQATLNMEISL